MNLDAAAGRAAGRWVPPNHPPKGGSGYSGSQMSRPPKHVQHALQAAINSSRAPTAKATSSKSFMSTLVPLVGHPAPCRLSRQGQGSRNSFHRPLWRKRTSSRFAAHRQALRGDCFNAQLLLTSCSSLSRNASGGTGTMARQSRAQPNNKASGTRTWRLLRLSPRSREKGA